MKVTEKVCSILDQKIKNYKNVRILKMINRTHPDSKFTV